MPRGPNRAQAWIWEVANPLLQNLETAKRILDSGVYTWRFLRDRLELIEVASGYFEPDEVPNLEDFCENNPAEAKAVEEWDDAVRVLRGNLAQESHSLTTQNPDFSAVVRAAARDFLASGKPHPFGLWPEERWPALIAEHVVNNEFDEPPGDRPHRLGTQEFLCENRERIRATFSADPFWQRWHRENHDNARKASSACERLIEALKTARRRLAEEFDIPLAPPKRSPRA